MIPGRVVGWSIRVRLLRWAGMDLGGRHPGLPGWEQWRPGSLGVVVDVVVEEPDIRDAVAALDATLRALAVERWTLDDVDLGGEEAGSDGTTRRRAATFAHRECAREIVMPGCPGGEA